MFPGRLSVSRTFGDVEAKLAEFGGNDKVVIHTPEITKFQIDSTCDFLLLASDGIFDKIPNNEECVGCVWDTYKSHKKETLHEQLGLGVDAVMKTAALRRSLDNITVLIVGLEGMASLFPDVKPEIPAKSSLAGKQRQSRNKKIEQIQQQIVTHKDMLNEVPTDKRFRATPTERQYKLSLEKASNRKKQAASSRAMENPASLLHKHPRKTVSRSKAHMSVTEVDKLHHPKSRAIHSYMAGNHLSLRSTKTRKPKAGAL